MSDECVLINQYSTKICLHTISQHRKIDFLQVIRAYSEFDRRMKEREKVLNLDTLIRFGVMVELICIKLVAINGIKLMK